MSLLMKALKKAEENQKSVPAEREPTLGELEQELALEPVEAASASKAAPAPRAEESVAAKSAANLFQAKQSVESSGRGKAMLWVIVAGMLVLSGGGVYIYLAINHPALLRFPSPSHPVPSAPVVPSEPAPASVPESPVVGGMVIPDDVSHAENNPAPTALATPVVAEAERKPTVAESVRGSDEAIRVSRSTKMVVGSDLENAYLALQEGRLGAARGHYQMSLQQEPRNLDALLGMAVVAGRDNRLEESGRYYLRALEVAPRSAVAQAGLLSLLGPADPAGSELRLKQLLAEQPAAFLHFTLGNLLASQERWPEAQQSYFQAYHLDADNPDYAFNLAVALEHLNQPKPALTYYRRALALLQGHGAGFDRASAEARISQLSQATE